MVITGDSYRLGVIKTESRDIDSILSRIKDPDKIRLLHAAMGLATEAGEIVDALKKHIYYGKELDLVNLEEELGDLSWYMAVMIDAMSQLGQTTSFERIWSLNISKLEKRYGDEFSEEAAINRDLDAERKVLENGK